MSAIIAAAGRGTRMGPNIDKLFLEVAGHPRGTQISIFTEPGIDNPEII